MCAKVGLVRIISPVMRKGCTRLPHIALVAHKHQSQLWTWLREITGETKKCRTVEVERNMSDAQPKESKQKQEKRSVEQRVGNYKLKTTKMLIQHRFYNICLFWHKFFLVIAHK